MNLTSNPVQEISGDVICPGDKSISQRILIIGSLLNCDINVSGFLNAKDPLSTMAALNQIGALINIDGDLVKIKVSMILVLLGSILFESSALCTYWNLIFSLPLYAL